jgi:hypothetical protein
MLGESVQFNMLHNVGENFKQSQTIAYRREDGCETN